MISNILVIGATGGVGRRVVEELRARSIVPTLLVRDPAAARAIFGEADFLVGDALTLPLPGVINGRDVVICALGSREPDGLRRVDLPAVSRLARAAADGSVKRFVLCSTIGAVPTPGVPDHLIQAFAPKGEAEAALIASGVGWVIVRPGRLSDDPTDDPRSIERRSVALALVEAAFRPDAAGRIYELSNARLGKPEADPVLGLPVDTKPAGGAGR